MILLRLILILMAVGLCLPVSVDARSRVVSKDEPIFLEADEVRYDHENQVYQAEGDVRLIQGELEVLADRMQWNRATGDMDAAGNVRFFSPDETLTGDSACYNLNSGTGRVKQGYFFLYEDNLHLHGSTIEQLGEDTYRVTSGNFTTCDGDVPAWKFGANRLDVTMGGYAQARHARFYIKDIPALYFPYFLYPAKTERESGLLIPSAGYSKKRGFTYNAAYYQVLGINQDATLYVDYLSKMGLGKGLEYRYIFGRETAGEARVYHIDVDRVDGERVDEERYALEWQHRGYLPGGVLMTADALYVNNDEYFRDFGDIAGDYNRNQAQSQLFLSKNWGGYNLVGLTRYTRNLRTDQRRTLQLLPRINFDVMHQRIGGTPFSYGLGTEYTHFWRREGLKGQRLMLRPELSMTVRPVDVVSVTPAVAYRQRYYWGLNRDESTADKGIVEFTTRVSTVPLQRIYRLPTTDVSRRLRHSLEPEVVYSYIPEVDQQDLPSFDRYDRIAAANRLEYALVQRLRLRSDSEEGRRHYRDLVYLRVSVLQHLHKDAEERGFGDLRAQLTLRPTQRTWIGSDITYDTRVSERKSLLVEGGISDAIGNELRLFYQEEPRRELEYGAVNLSLAFLAPIYLSYEQRYDFYNRDRLEQRLGIEYRHQCWSVLLELKERTDGERAFMLTFTLRGIGSVGGISGGLGGGS